jgi:hypothetical protein
MEIRYNRGNRRVLLSGPEQSVRREHFDTIGGTVGCQIQEGDPPPPAFADLPNLKDLGRTPLDLHALMCIGRALTAHRRVSIL